MATAQLAVLLSGGGRTLQNILDRIGAGTLSAEVAVVISNDPEAYGLVRAARARVPTFVVRPRDHADTGAFSDHISEICDEFGVGLIVMAGFLKMYRLPPRYAGKVMNIHPALLPCFGGKGMYGHRVHEAVLEAGCKVSGCTVHFADNEYDHGPIIVQRTVPVEEDDTAEALAARVFEQECIAYPEAIQYFAEGRLRIEGRRVRVSL